MREPTLLLVFIHGFKGDDGTFGDLVEHLAALLRSARPSLKIQTAVYPQYETRGDLNSCVARFRDWLQDTVIELEVSLRTPSPTVDPSVHVVLIGHSMGGIVGADALISVLDDPAVGGAGRIAFPHIVGMLAFDTPYLGLAPSMFAHSAEGNWKTASTAFSQISAVASGLFASSAASEGAVAKVESEKAKAEEDEEKRKEEESSAWGHWGKVAAFGGAAAALAGGAAVAYMKRDDLASGFSWVSSHLEFVGALMKGEELKARVNRASNISGVGFANLFTSLGERSTSTLFDGKERTFCSIPDECSPLRKKFYRCVNQKAKDEVDAHVSMFTPMTNPNYYDLADRARSLICVWVLEDAFPRREDENPWAQSYEKEKEKKSKRRSSKASGSYAEEEFGRRGSSSSRIGSPSISRSNSWAHQEVEALERRGSHSSRHSKSEKRKSSSRTNSFDVQTERKSASRTNSFDVSGEKKERRSKQEATSMYADLEHNPWK